MIIENQDTSTWGDKKNSWHLYIFLIDVFDLSIHLKDWSRGEEIKLETPLKREIPCVLWEVLLGF